MLRSSLFATRGAILGGGDGAVAGGSPATQSACFLQARDPKIALAATMQGKNDGCFFIQAGLRFEEISRRAYSRLTWLFINLARPLHDLFAVIQPSLICAFAGPRDAFPSPRHGRLLARRSIAQQLLALLG